MRRGLCAVGILRPQGELGSSPVRLQVWGKSGLPGGASGKEPACQCRRSKRLGFHPWVRKILWRKAWQPTPVLLPGESHGQRNPWATVYRVAQSQTRLSD